MMPYIINLIVIFLFLFCFYYFKNHRKLMIFSIIYAFVFEFFAVYLGGYIYNSPVNVFKIPLYILLSWSIIITSSYYLISQITKEKFTKAFLVSIYVLALDLVFEASAVFLKLWEWNVNNLLLIDPANFIGWLLVVFSFILAYEYRPYLSVFIGFFVYLILGFLYKTIFELVKINLLNGYFPVILLFLIFVFFSVYLLRKNISKNLKNGYLVVFSIRFVYYFFGVFIALSYNFFFNSFYLILLLIAILIEVFVFLVIRYDLFKVKYI